MCFELYSDSEVSEPPVTSGWMCDGQPLVALLCVGLWAGCQIPQCAASFPLSPSLGSFDEAFDFD